MVSDVSKAHSKGDTEDQELRARRHESEALDRLIPKLHSKRP